jgi:homoserine dehydrogenase
VDREEKIVLQEIKIGLLGLGTVGSGVYRILTERQKFLAQKTGLNFIPKRILVRDLGRKRAVAVDPGLLTTDPTQVVAHPEIDLVVEVLGGVEPARSLIAAALQAKKSVITANKELIATHGAQLYQLAREQGVDLFFEASVAGGIPILGPLQHSLAGEDIEAVYGIVNGTTNYILTAMTEQARSYADVLAEAQALGYAEADPTADVAGHDAARKLAILAALAFDQYVDLDDVYCEGIEKIKPADIAFASQLGYVVKLVAIARKKAAGLEARVHPALVPAGHPLAGIKGVFNGIIVEGWAVGSLLFTGAGAGQMPTGSAVVGDIVAAAKNYVAGQRGKPGLGFVKKSRVLPMEEVENSYYLRLQVEAGTMAVAKVVRHLSEAGVELKTLEICKGNEQVDLILKTSTVKEGIFMQVLSLLQAERDIKQVDAVIRCLVE